MIKEYNVIRKVRKSGTSLAVNIPKEIVEIMDIKEGEIVEIEFRKIKK